MTWALRSTPITGASSLLRPSPPPLRRVGTLASRCLPFDILPYHRLAGSHVPYGRLRHVHAAYTPPATRTVSRFPPGLSPRSRKSSGFGMGLIRFDASSTVHFRSSPWRVPDSYSLPFPQRSVPQLFTTAPWGGLVPPPTRRLRRVYRHHP